MGSKRDSERRVLVQLNSLELGGTQLVAVDFARAVRRHGFESVLTGPRDSVPAKGPSLLDAAALHHLRVVPYDRAPDILRTGRRAMNLRAREAQADIVHIYGTHGEPRLAFWGPCFAGRRPFVQTVYEMAVDDTVYTHTELIVGTGYLRDELRNRPGGTTMISPPVDLLADMPNDDIASEFRNSLDELGQSELIVIVSRLDSAMKAVPVESAILAMKLIAHREVALVIVGTGTEATRLEMLGAQINEQVGRRLIHFVGPMADPRPAYAAADVMLGMGGSAARSLAFAKPLIVQGELGTSEVFRPRTARELFHRSFWSQEIEPDPPAALAAAIVELLDDKHQREQLGLFGRQFATEHFALDQMAESLAKVYERARAYGPIAWILDLNKEVPRLADSVLRRLATGSRLGRKAN